MWAAKWSKVKVHEFGIGLPPKIFTLWKDKGGTHYTINLIPLGGFVKIKGEAPETAESEDKDSLLQATFPKKVFIILWWIIMNLLFAFFVFTILFSTGIQPLALIEQQTVPSRFQSHIIPTTQQALDRWLSEKNIVTDPATILEVTTGSRAALIGMKQWTTITTINAINVDNQTLKSQLQKLENQTFPIERIYQNTAYHNSITCDQDCTLGVLIEDKSTTILYETKLPVIQALSLAGKEIWQQTRVTLWMLGKIIKNLAGDDKDAKQQSIDSLAWPVWAVKIAWLILEQRGIKQFMAFAALISLALAIFNLLPIPALDGGRLLSFIIQKLTHADPKKYFMRESYINVVVFVLLFALWIIIIFKDLSQLWWIHFFN